MNTKAKIAVPTEQIAQFCHRHHIRKLSLFGSVLRDDFGSKSDVDVLVEFEPGKTPGLAFFDIRRGRWEYLDFRVICVFRSTEGERKAEIKQDFTASYRVYDSRPFWPEK